MDSNKCIPETNVVSDKSIPETMWLVIRAPRDNVDSDKCILETNVDSEKGIAEIPEAIWIVTSASWRQMWIVTKGS